jgi:hypothetical protein
LNAFTFSVADVSFHFALDHSVPMLCVADHFRDFVRENRGSNESASYAVTQAPAESSDKPVLWGNDMWRIRGDDAGFELDIKDTAKKTWRTGAVLDKALASGSLHHHPATVDIDLFPFPLEYPIVTARLLCMKGLVLHASCVAVDGQGILFIGKSGHGKTTLARLWKKHGAVLLNDERNILRWNDREVIVGSSPWHGEENEVNAQVVPLAAMVFIEHGEANVIDDLSPSKAAARLLQHAFLPVFFPGYMEQALEICDRVLPTVPALAMQVVPNADAVRVLRERVLAL